jgi:hypothetical protein
MKAQRRKGKRPEGRKTSRLFQWVNGYYSITVSLLFTGIDFSHLPAQIFYYPDFYSGFSN